MADSYTASDYAGIEGGAYEFYYGYEQTNIKEEWLFVATVRGIEVASWTAEQLGMDQWDDPERVLMSGIAKFLESISDQGEQ